MTITTRTACALFFAICGFAAGPPGAAASTSESRPLLEWVADIPLPGGTSRFDYQSLDPTTGRLYISHMGAGDIVVFDTNQNKVVANVPGFPVVTGVLVVPSLKLLYASVTANHEIAVMDTDKLAVVKRIKDGKFPDGIAFSPETHKVFVSDESGEVETVIDAQTNERVATIPMGGEVGNSQYDPIARLIYACVQTRNEFVAIDPTSNSIAARYPLKGGDHPHGFYIDVAGRKAYISCQGDNKLLVFDLNRHVVEEVFDVGKNPDVLAFDAEKHLLYVACESGVVSIFQCVNGKAKKLADQSVGPNSHSVSVDSMTHNVYFPLKNVNGAPLLRIMRPGD